MGFLLALALMLQAPLALAGQCLDHASHDEPVPAAPAAAMPDCHEMAARADVAPAVAADDCCEGGCACPEAAQVFAFAALPANLAALRPVGPSTALPGQPQHPPAEHLRPPIV